MKAPLRQFLSRQHLTGGHLDRVEHVLANDALDVTRILRGLVRREPKAAEHVPMQRLPARSTECGLDLIQCFPDARFTM